MIETRRTRIGNSVPENSKRPGKPEPHAILFKASIVLLAFTVGWGAALSPGLVIGDAWPPSLFVNRIATAVGIFALLLIHSKRGKPEASGWLASQQRTFLLIGLLTCALGALSLLWTPSRDLGANRLVSISLAILAGITLVALVGRSSTGLSLAVRGWVYGAVLIAFWALWEQRTGTHFGAFRLEYALQYGLDWASTVEGLAWVSFANPNDLGGFLGLSVAISLWAVHAASKRTTRLLMICLASLFAYVGLAVTDSRMFALLIVVTFLAYSIDLVAKPHSATRPLLLATVAALLILAVITFSAEISSMLTSYQAVSSTLGADSLRLEVVSSGISILIASLGFGLGVGAQAVLIGNGTLPTNWHNIFVELSVEISPLIGIAILASLVAPVFRWANPRPSVPPGASRAAALLALALIAYGLVASSVAATPSFWCGLAILASQRAFIDRAIHAHPNSSTDVPKSLLASDSLRK